MFLGFKLIVTHNNPDLDAVASAWILKRFDEQNFSKAKMAFVDAGAKISDKELVELGIDEGQVAHVDTGLGEFDHHTEELAREKTCAAALTRDHVMRIHPELEDDEALGRIVAHVTDVDHFGEFYWPQPNSDHYLFQLDEILRHLKTIGRTDAQVAEFGFTALDSIYASFGARVAAEEEVKQAQEFETVWGKALGVETANDDVIKFAQKEGFMVVVRKDPNGGNVRIKAAPGKNIDLTKVYEKMRARDSKATWYLHPGKAMLLNGSRKKKGQVPSRLSLEEVIVILSDEKSNK